MAKPAIDLARLVQRREQFAYEQQLVRRSYAYGVDLRRSAWLDHSTFGEPLMRSVDRRWNGLIEALSSDEFQPANHAPPNEVMEEILRLLRLLHAPIPTLRLLHPSASGSWPIVTPLGTTKGGCHWLVMDLERLMAVTPNQRSFLLGSGLANLQCDHGPRYAAHLLAYRQQRGVSMVRTLLRPWSRVAVFSADRAGLLSVGDTDIAIDAVKTFADPGVPWHPPLPEATQRVQALKDFGNSRTLARLRLIAQDGGEWTLAPTSPQQPDAAPNDAKSSDAKSSDAKSSDAKSSDAKSSDAKSSDAKSSDAKSSDVEASDTEASEAAAREADELTAKAKVIEETLRKAWPLARCDQRLTRRLGLL